MGRNNISLKLFFTAFTLATVDLAAAQNVSVMVDGKTVAFCAVEPATVNGRVMVPVRGVFEQMGANVTWDAVRQEVVAHHGADTIVLPIGSTNAQINGKISVMDTPAIVMRGRTLVPLRFLSEALDARVQWISAERTVAIWTNHTPENPDSAGYTTMVLETGTVIPFRLNEALSSKTSKAGDKFTATLDSSDYANYRGMTPGSVIEGHVETAQPMEDNTPGVLGLTFDKVRTPDGRTYSVDGTLIALDNKSVKNVDGHLTAKPGAKSDLKYVGYGAGAGLLVAIVTKSNVVTGTLIGSALGYLFGELEKSKAHEVSLKADTKFGVRLTDDLAIRVPTVASAP